MGAKKKVKQLTATNEELEKSLSVLRGQLTKAQTKLAKAEDRVKRWKEEAAAARTAASRSDARAEKLQKKLDRATDAIQPTKAVEPTAAAAAGVPTDQPTTAEGLTPPDESWTVAELRAEARARGLTGISNMPKAQLLDALNDDARG
jgi:peptidoglycan hydrolase CwlO-like protein